MATPSYSLPLPLSPSFPLAAAIRTAALLSPPPCLFLSHFAPRLRVLGFPSSNLPPPFGRSVGEGCGRPTGGRRQIAGRRSSAVVMKTYEIYSIWADAITPSADRGGGQPPTNPRGYTSRCMRARVCMCVCLSVCVYEVWHVVVLKIARSLFRRMLLPRGLSRLRRDREG